MKRKILELKRAQQLLNDNRANLALLIGNGINRTAGASGGVSWDQLMKNLMHVVAAGSPDPAATQSRLESLSKQGTDGQTAASLPEVFDIIQAIGKARPGEATPTTGAVNLQTKIATMLRDMKPGVPHKALVNWAWKFSIPILTTNYDHCLQEALFETCSRKRFRGKKTSAYYPWTRYYSPEAIDDPVNEFAVWHVHGDRDLRRSIRAGLDQYMGMAQRLRKLNRAVASEALNGPIVGQEEPAYLAAPWLLIFMGRKLWIQGLGLRAAEVSLRWLLIQRFRFWCLFKKEHHKDSGWYVHGPTDDIGPLDEGRRAFFENVGLTVIEIAKASESYTALFRIPQPAGS